MINNPMVGSTSNPHLNPASSSSKDVGLVPSYKNKQSSLTLYVPDNIDIDRILSENPPDFKYYRDNFVYILHLITSIPARKRDILKSHKGFTPVNREFLQKRIHDYKPYIDYLVKQSVLVEDNYYIPREKSKGLKFLNPSKKLKSITITKWTLIKSIKYSHKGYNTELTEKYNFLKKWFDKNLNVNYDACIEFLENKSKIEIEEAVNISPSDIDFRFLCRQLPILKLKQRNFNFHVDNTGFRLHTVFTNMPSDLRKFCSYDGKTLCAVDISNSQLYLAIALLDNDIFIKNNIMSIIPIYKGKSSSPPPSPIMLVNFIMDRKNNPDVLKFKKLVASGLFYERFGEELIKKGLMEPDVVDIRKRTKEIVFQSIYSPTNNASFSESIKIFKKTFPSVYEIFSRIKTVGKHHSTLSVTLQRLEADLVLNKACRRISQKYPFIPLFTVHDSIVTTEQYVRFVKSELYNVLKENIGIAPGLKIERWE